MFTQLQELCAQGRAVQKENHQQVECHHKNATPRIHGHHLLQHEGFLARQINSFVPNFGKTPNANWQGTTNVSCVFMAQECLAVQSVCPDSQCAVDRTISAHVSTHAPLTSRTLPLALPLSFAWCHLYTFTIVPCITEVTLYPEFT